MAYESFYQGAPYGMDAGSDSLYTGAKLSQGSIGASTGVQTANQIQDVTNYLNQGMKTIEVSTIQPEVFDMIPKQHLQEMNRLAKLTNADITLHAPIIEPSGFTQQGGWSEQGRELAERQLTNTVLRAHAISPDKPMPITMHASGIPGTEKMPIDIIGKDNLTPEEKEIYEKTGAVPTQMVVVNQATGELTGLKREQRFYPGAEGRIYTPEKEREIANRSYWDNKLSNLIFYKERGDEILHKSIGTLKEVDKEMNKAEVSEEEKKLLLEKANYAQNALGNVNIYIENSNMALNSIYNEAYKVADDEGRKMLLAASKKYEENLQKNGGDINTRSRAMQTLINDMQMLMTIPNKHMPELYKPAEQFAVEKAGETFANVAWNAYDKLGEKAPIISIENPPYGYAISTADDLRALVKESRKKFAERAVKNGVSEDEAKNIAAAMIGATWDTSHISMMRKQGFGKEELVKEAEKIAPFVKHVHMNDNFGYSHTDLPPGMGDVPFKDIMKKLQEKGYKGKNIFEGGNFFQHFKTAPHAMVLEAMGSPIYGMAASPTWTKTYGTIGSYSSGYGAFLPEQHFSTYGAGFSGLPTELGGQIAGKQSRLSGTPNV